MSQEMMLFLVRATGITIALVLVVLALKMSIKMMTGTDSSDNHPNGYRGSTLDKKQSRSSGEVDDFEVSSEEARHKTSRLNPSFFGGIEEGSEAKSAPLADYPTMNLPLSIMPRQGKHFTGKGLVVLFQTFGLQRSPNHAFELLTHEGDEILFSVLNIRKPGIFPEALEEVDKIEGLLLVMQLPVGQDALVSWETYVAMAAEMADSVDGRLCDYQRVPMGDKDLLNYRAAAESFENDYNAWLAKRA